MQSADSHPDSFFLFSQTCQVFWPSARTHIISINADMFPCYHIPTLSLCLQYSNAQSPDCSQKSIKVSRKCEPMSPRHALKTTRQVERVKPFAQCVNNNTHTHTPECSSLSTRTSYSLSPLLLLLSLRTVRCSSSPCSICICSQSNHETLPFFPFLFSDFGYFCDSIRVHFTKSANHKKLIAWWQPAKNPVVVA